MKIIVGQLYEIITDSFVTTGQHNRVKRPVFLKKGEIIEIRFQYKWHFRTKDNQYFHAKTKIIEDNCKLIGEIYEPVRFANRASLEDILRIQLYTKSSP